MRRKEHSRNKLEEKRNFFKTRYGVFSFGELIISNKWKISKFDIQFDLIFFYLDSKAIPRIAEIKKLILNVFWNWSGLVFGILTMS